MASPECRVACELIRFEGALMNLHCHKFETGPYCLLSRSQIVAIRFVPKFKSCNKSSQKKRISARRNLDETHRPLDSFACAAGCSRRRSRTKQCHAVRH